MLSKYFDRIYFVSATRFAADVKRQFIDGPEAKVDPIIMIAGQGQCRGTLGGQWFFQLYGGKERTVICADDAPAAAAARPTLDIPVFEYRPGVGFVRIAAQSTDTARSHVPMRPPGIVRVGPNPVDHGHPFNQQPNGQSAIWIELDRRADSDFVLALDGLPLATYVRDDILTAVIPDHFFEKPGTHWLRVRVTRGNISGESAPVAFVVR
jgi:hypothetical protein